MNRDKKDSSYGNSLRYLPGFAQLSNSLEHVFVFHLAVRIDSRHLSVKNADPVLKILLIYRFSHMLFEKRSGFSRLWKV